MSKFFATGGSSSESEEESGSDSEIEQVQRKVTSGRAAVLDSDSDSEEEKRVVKSHKDKAWESMMEGIGRIKNSMKTNDWSVIHDEFHKVNALLEKAKARNGVPKFYVKMLGTLNDFVNVSLKDKESIKKMKKPTAHALNQMKLAIRKQCDKFKAEVDNFKEHPELYEEEIEVSKKAPLKSKAVESSDEESSEEESDSDDDDDDSDEDSDEVIISNICSYLYYWILHIFILTAMIPNSSFPNEFSERKNRNEINLFKK